MSATYLRVYDATGITDVLPEHESSIDAAVGHWLDTSRDTLLRLTMLDGSEFTTKASGIAGWFLSTPEGRLRSLELEKASGEEDRDNRIAVGLPWEDAA